MGVPFKSVFSRFVCLFYEECRKGDFQEGGIHDQGYQRYNAHTMCIQHDYTLSNSQNPQGNHFQCRLSGNQRFPHVVPHDMGSVGKGIHQAPRLMKTETVFAVRQTPLEKAPTWTPSGSLLFGGLDKIKQKRQQGFSQGEMEGGPLCISKRMINKLYGRRAKYWLDGGPSGTF